MVREYDGYNEIPRYLCYLLCNCEQGSEGWAAWAYYCVAEGNTAEEVVENWLENVKLLYKKDLSEDMYIGTDNTTIFFHGNKFCMNRLQTDVYGYPQKINIEFPYEKHLE